MSDGIDYWITGKRLDSGKTRIIALERRHNSEALFAASGIVSKDVVVNDILNKRIVYYTARKINGKWQQGSRVRVIPGKNPGEYYLRSDANNIAWDNLDELPDV